MAILFIDTMPPGRVKDHHVFARQLRQRQLPGNPWEVYSDKTPVRELLDTSRALGSRGGGYALCWLTEGGLEAPASVSLADLVARQASPAPVAPARPRGETAGAARHGRLNLRARRGHGGGNGVVLEEADDDDDMPVDDTDEDDPVDDLA